MIREKDWRVYTKRADFSAIAERLGISPVMARILVNRDMDTDEKREEYLFGTLNMIPDVGRMRGMDQAVSLLRKKIENGQKIRIISDYDVDGVTSNYVLYDGLKRLGADVSYDIPDRIRDGYGMNIRMVEEAYADSVDTLLTCDNGISAFAAIDRAKELGMTVVVTDHHQVQGELPAADVIVNPWQPLCEYPFKTICGVEVAYKLIRRLFEADGRPLEPTEYMEFVALGTVCDVMPVIGENRIIVREGMRIMPSTENPGLKALLSVNGLLDGRDITVYHLGFIIGPSINSEGRLASAKEAMDLLLTTDPLEAEERALAIKQLNDERKSATEAGVAAAISIIEQEGMWEKDKVFVIHVPGIHESLAGIVAGKIKERYYRPTIIFTDSAETPEILKGSARSIPDYNIFEALTSAADLLDHFGGHPMAAGGSVRRENVDLLRKRLNKEAALTEEQLVEKVYIDVPMPLCHASLALAEQIQQLEPFGTGNPRPLFADRGLQVEGLELTPSGKLLKLKVRDRNRNFFTIKSFSPEMLVNDIKMWSECDDCDKIVKYPQLDLIYRISVNEYNGDRSLEFWVEQYRKHEEQ